MRYTRGSIGVRSNLIILSKADTGVFHMERLTWVRVRGGNKEDSAIVICGEGHVGSISEEHTITPYGIVFPEIVCGEKGCAWREYVRLEGWREE